MNDSGHRDRSELHFYDYDRRFNNYTYVGGNPVSLSDPTGNCPWYVGALIGGGVNLLEQLYLEEKSLQCVNIGSVLASAAFGAVSPGWLQIYNKAKRARGALPVLSRQLEKAQTVARKSKIEARMNSMVTDLGDDLVLQGLMQGSAYGIKRGTDDKPWTFGGD